MRAKLFIGTLLLATVLVAAGLSACASRQAAAPATLDLAVDPGGVTLDGQPLTLAQLDSRLALAARRGDRVLLESDSWARLSAPSFSRSQIAKARALQARVLAIAARRGVTLLRFTMPVRGWSSPSPEAQ